MSAGEQARLKGFYAPRQRLLQVERTYYAILRSAERKIDHRNRSKLARHCSLATALLAVLTPGAVRTRIAVIAAAGDCTHRRQQIGQTAHGGRFAGAAIA